MIGADDPRARAAVELDERHPDPRGHRAGPQMSGDVFVEEGFVYPDRV